MAKSTSVIQPSHDREDARYLNSTGDNFTGTLSSDGIPVIQNGEWVGDPTGLIGPQGPTGAKGNTGNTCLLYTSPSPRDGLLSRMPSSA